MEDTRIVSIIMVARDHLDLTQAALRTLNDTTDSSQYVLYFYDNNSELPDTNIWVTNFCKENGIDLHYILANWNRGWIDCVNRAYSAVGTEFALTVHNDVTFPQYWLRHFMRKFEDKNVAAVGPVISYAMGPQAQANAHLYFGCEPKFLLGLFFMCRKSVLDEIRVGDSYLSPAYGMGDREEIELCYRIRKLGYKFKIAYDVKIGHVGEKAFIDYCGSAEEFHKYQERHHEILIERLGKDVVEDMFEIEMKSVKLMVGLLTRDTMIHYKFHFSTLGLWGNLFQSGAVKLVSSFHIGRGHPTDRNVIIEAAIEQGFTHVLFIDDDMVFPDDAAIRMLEHDVDICTGTAYQRAEPHAPCVFVASPEKEIYPIDLEINGLIEIDTCGGYFLLIKLESIKNMEKPYFKWGDTELGYCMEASGIGEDIYFGLKAKLAGAKIYCDTNIDIQHIGDEKMINQRYYKEYKDSGQLTRKLNEKKLKLSTMKVKFD